MLVAEFEKKASVRPLALLRLRGEKAVAQSEPIAVAAESPAPVAAEPQRGTNEMPISLTLQQTTLKIRPCSAVCWSQGVRGEEGFSRERSLSAPAPAEETVAQSDLLPWLLSRWRLGADSKEDEDDDDWDDTGTKNFAKLAKKREELNCARSSLTTAHRPRRTVCERRCARGARART